MPVVIKPYTGQIPGFTFDIWAPRKKNNLAELAENAKAELEYLRAQGFPDVVVNVLDSGAPYAGLWELGQIWLFGDNQAPGEVRATTAHEYGHFAWYSVLAVSRCQEYWDTRGGAVAPEAEVAAEDFRLLFGSPEARKRSHIYQNRGAGALGFEYGEPVQHLLGWPERRERLKAIIMEAVRKATEPPSDQKAGASKFSDIAGHWAEEDILECAKIGVLRGDPDGRFRPEDKVTRAELAVVVRRLVNLLGPKGGMTDGKDA